ncbi:GDSL lipase/esterase [Dillenia turbinata]|uniref:GDSL lipase/esterase n=1 Tax=Dillenia turbinata TaxID=194707 RepID=A0AAN8W3N9_9MAGN
MTLPNTYSLSHIILFLLFSLLASFLPCNCTSKPKQPNEARQVKGMFVFGSSLVDNGNNNFLQNSMAKADYLPYGIDFPLGPSGRFTNGKNVIDLLGDRLKLPSLIPAFADPSTKGNKIVHGVNYASGASGILDETGIVAGNVINLKQQINNFEEVTLPELEVRLGCKSTELLPHYLFILGTGGNDYSLNYFLSNPIPNNNNVSSLQFFTAKLITSLYNHLKKLYSLGGRRFVVMSINPLGCSPVIQASRPTHEGCRQDLNQAARLFNARLRQLVDVAKSQLPHSNFVFVNSYRIMHKIITHPTSNGFNDARSACCEVAALNEGGNGILCKKDGRTCANRSMHVFFDGLHPTEAVNVIIANKAFASNLTADVYPININHLALLY